MLMRRLVLGLMTLGATAALSAGPLMFAQPASANTAPYQACGDTQPGPCQDTAHFSDINDKGTPAPPGGGCPAFLSQDYFTFVGTGNGIEHVNVNKAQDGWFTSTFTGQVTITAYLHGTQDQNGNVTDVSDPDPNVLPYTGRITEWFGGSINNKNAVFHGTQNFSVSDATGNSIRIHFVSHASWTPGMDPTGPPHIGFDNITCS